MEKTMQAEMARKIVCSQLLDENSLLILSKKEDEKLPIASIRYIENESIKEDKIAVVSPTTTIQYNDKMVAVLDRVKGNKDYTLSSVYSLENHEFVETDLRVFYDSKSEEGKRLQYIKAG